MLLMVRLELPVLVSVTGWDVPELPTTWTPNVRLVGLRTGNAPTPVPDNETVCGLFGALSFTLTVPLIDPTLCGSKSTVMLQLEPGLRDAGQLLLVTLKSLWLVVTLVMLTASVPVL